MWPARLHLLLWAGLACSGGDRGYVSVEGVAGRAAGGDLPTACACSDKFPVAGMWLKETGRKRVSL